MQITKSQQESIRKSFQEISGVNDFLELCNEVKKLIYTDRFVPFELRHLGYHSNPRLNKRRYTTFEIKKKNKGTRTIHAPNKGLKSLQTCVNIILQCVFTPGTSTFGFVAGRSITDNARIHTGNIYVYNIDLQNFFPSIDQARIWGRIQHPPFNLSGSTAKARVANIIAGLCCHKMEVSRMNDKGEMVLMERRVLPQGAPTSPVLSNIICQRLDYYLSAMARKFGVKFSRYADDITFSSMHNVYQTGSNFLTELERIVIQENFLINTSKTRLQKDGFRQEVTGLTVNKHANVSKRYINQVRRWVYYWETYGYEKASAIFIKNLKKDKKFVQGKAHSLEETLRGKIAFIKMVKGSDDTVYQGYLRRFEQLLENAPTSLPGLVDIGQEVQVRHSPSETVKALKYFKYENEYAFKELVHRPLDYKGFDFEQILRKANAQFNKISMTGDERLEMSKGAFAGIKGLLGQLRELGVPFFRRTGQHPLTDRKLGLVIQEFKGNYRFGNEKSESSVLADLILNTARKRQFEDHKTGEVFSFGETDSSGAFNIEQLCFLPERLKFQSKANFFTWVPSIRIALSVIFDSILQHSNIGGTRPFKASDKKIEVDIARRLENGVIKIDLSILDRGSVYMGGTEDMMNLMRRDYLQLLIGVADFKIQYSTIDGNSHECRILPFAEKPTSLNAPVGGFKFIFTFYD